MSCNFANGNLGGAIDWERGGKTVDFMFSGAFPVRLGGQQINGWETAPERVCMDEALGYWGGFQSLLKGRTISKQLPLPH